MAVGVRPSAGQAEWTLAANIQRMCLADTAWLLYISLFSHSHSDLKVKVLLEKKLLVTLTKGQAGRLYLGLLW